MKTKTSDKKNALKVIPFFKKMTIKVVNVVKKQGLRFLAFSKVMDFFKNRALNSPLFKKIFGIFNCGMFLFLLKKVVEIFKKYGARLFVFLKNSWRSVLVFVPMFLLFYYVIGAALSHKVDLNLTFEPKKTGDGYVLVDLAAGLIERETEQNLYTPNLPVIFPAYVLDNMPAFQKGIFRSVRAVVGVMAKNSQSPDIIKAKELLDYPTDVWLFSKTKDFKIAPSSVAQYRKARRKLLEFNKQASPSLMLNEKIKKRLSADLSDISRFLEDEIKTVGFLKADDAYYEALGRLYADYLFLRLTPPQYEPALKVIEEGLSLRPIVVRNGRLGHLFGTNHLIELSYFALKAHMLLVEFDISLQEK